MPAGVAVDPPVAFGEVSVSSLNDAKDAMLERLERKGKILLAAGRFLQVDSGSAYFGLPNPMHLQRCVEWAGPWEAVVRAFTGAALSVILTVDPLDDGPAQASSDRPPQALASLPEPAEHDVDDFYPDELTDAPSVPIATTLDHLTKAFPGAQVVEDGANR